MFKTYRIVEKTRQGFWGLAPGDAEGWERSTGLRAMRLYARSLDFATDLRLVCEQDGSIAARCKSEGTNIDSLTVFAIGGAQ